MKLCCSCSLKLSTFKLLFLFLVLFLLTTFFFYAPLGRRRVSRVSHVLPSGYLITTPGCSVLKYESWSPSITHAAPHLKCSREAIDVLVSQKNDGSFSVDPVAKEKLLGTERSSTFRCTKCEVRRNEREHNKRSDFSLSAKVIEFVDATSMDVELAEIKCYSGNTTLYQNYFFYPVRKAEVEAECASNFQDHVKEHPTCSEAPRLSVLVLGIDGVFRSTLTRMLPNTRHYVVNDLNGIDMLGYTKVGTYHMPYMKDCFLENPTKTIDNNCTFLLNTFAEAGYRTAFVDNCDRCNILVYNRGGFRRQVAHYHSHALFDTVIENCWRGKTKDQMVLDWAFMFQKEFANDLHFGHFWIYQFPDDDQYPAQGLDATISGALKLMNEEGLLNNTLLVLMSERGTKTESFLETEVGRQEEKLPFMYLVFPLWFRQQFPEVMERVEDNGRRLITSFDLHETLKSVVNCEYAFNFDEEPSENLGMSLFKPISDFRTCADAGVPNDYCACKRDVVDLNPASKQAFNLGQVLVNHLNKRTRNVRKLCAKLYLTSILHAQNLELLAIDETKIDTTHIVSVLVNPGWAKFKATLIHFTRNSTYAIEGDVRRINEITNSSHCVANDDFLKAVCYCTS